MADSLNGQLQRTVEKIRMSVRFDQSRQSDSTAHIDSGTTSVAIESTRDDASLCDAEINSFECPTKDVQRVTAGENQVKGPPAARRILHASRRFT